MSKLLLLTPFVFIAATLSAQTPATVTLLTSQSSNNCPIGIAAQHTSGAVIEQVSPSSPHHPLSYNISLSAFDGRLIHQAKVTLHGIIGGHVLPAGSNPSTDATETFTLTPNHESKPTFQSVVYTDKLTGVDWIEVDEVTYANGTHWHQTANSVCRVTPNSYLPITAAAH